QLGRHRLMCGDATKYEDIEALLGGDRVNLVLTDPPYGIRVVNEKTGGIGSKGRAYAPVIGDTNGDMFTEHYRIIRCLCNRQIIWGGQNFTRILPPSCGWLFWDKCKAPGMSFGDGELAWSNIGTQIKKYVFMWDGFHRDGSKTLNAKVHPNQKPVELHARILEDFTQPGDVILDCFGGSGTTLIACEITGRKCLMMELSPEYCDIICERYDKLTKEGKTLWNN
ncbi:MAG: site-specific DNA-methyltransferase, partial [Synergistaceae bacterium]|nr:site-specific DNA-methyltransferase [Synergistaceae bacterium]